MDKEKIKTEKPKKEKKDIKKSLKSILALVLVAVVSIAGTLAFLQTQSSKKENVFLGSEGINLDLTEPNYEESKATDYAPGSTIKKDPILTNITTKEGYYEWVAIKVSYKKLLTENNTAGTLTAYEYTDKSGAKTTYYEEAITYKNLQNVINPIVFNGDSIITSTYSGDEGNTVNSKDWYLVQGGGDDDKYAIYMYKKRLYDATTAGVNGTNKTTELFEKVVIKSPMNSFFEADGSTTTQISNSTPANFPKFRIDIEGAAIKDEGYTYSNSGITTAVEHIENLTTDELTAIKNALIALFS